MLIKKHNDKYLIFEVMAESWDDLNKVNIKQSEGCFDTLEEAIHFAREIDETEYGVLIDILAKDGAGVVIVE